MATPTNQNHQDLIYHLIYWRLATMATNSLPWRDSIIENRDGNDWSYIFKFSRRLPAGSLCPFCYSPHITVADLDQIPGVARCACCGHVHLQQGANNGRQ